MSTERPTKEFVTTNGNVFLMNEYITGRDKRAIESVYLDKARISTKSSGGNKGEVEIGGVTGEVNHLMQDATLKVVIVSATFGQGETITDPDMIVEKLLDLSESEYTEVLEQVNSITDPKKA